MKLTAHESMKLVVSERLQPTQPPTETKKVNLSLLDTTTANFGPATSVWAYRNLNGRLTFDSLTTSLKETLNSFPQWCGHLKWADETKNHFALTYGTSDDPGIGFTCYTCTLSLEDVYPSIDTMKEKRYWKNEGEFDPSIELAFSAGVSLAAPHNESADGLPVILIQLTQFSCGGMAVMVRMAHVLADATSLTLFVEHWSLLHRGLSPKHSPIFDPVALDRHATAMNEQSLERVKSLPLLRYDLWSSGGDNCPDGMVHATAIPSDVKELTVPLGSKLPWDTWDMAAPVGIYFFYFSPDQLMSLWREANKGSSVQVSQHDAIMGWVWTAITKARNLQPSPDPKDNLIHLGVLIGFRGRVSPPLPDQFLGSPVNTVDVALDFSTVASSFQTAALAIRNTLGKFNSTAVCDMMYEISQLQRPYRHWNGFFGSTHTITTSWLRLNVQNIQFDPEGETPYFVHPLISKVDACVCILEAEAAKKDQKKWTEQGAFVRISLAESLMPKFMELFFEL